MKQILFFLAALPMLIVPSLSFGSTWKIDPEHSSVGFKVRHLMVSNVNGNFGKFEGVVRMDEKDISKSSVTATIETASIDTGVARRDADLKSSKFLDVAKYPTMKFASTSIVKSGEEKLKMTGDLTLHGVTRPVVLDVVGPTGVVKDPSGKKRCGATASGKINRKDFGLTWNKVMEAGGVLVGDEVEIAIEVELVESSL